MIHHFLGSRWAAGNYQQGAVQEKVMVMRCYHGGVNPYSSYKRFIGSSGAVRLSKYMFFHLLGTIVLATLSYALVEGPMYGDLSHCFGSYADIKPASFYDACNGPMYWFYVVGIAVMMVSFAILDFFINPLFALIDPTNFSDGYSPLYYAALLMVEVVLIRILLIYPVRHLRGFRTRDNLVV